jgi:hypothetical protein
MWILLSLDINIWRLVLRYIKNQSVTIMLQLETKDGNMEWRQVDICRPDMRMVAFCPYYTSHGCSWHLQICRLFCHVFERLKNWFLKMSIFLWSSISNKVPVGGFFNLCVLDSVGAALWQWNSKFTVFSSYHLAPFSFIMK